jgi:peptidyl-tRNA hydrolase, PTH2 family
MKQAILIRKDLKLSKGKLAVQTSHASVEATLRSKRDKLKQWHDAGMKKVVLKVEDLTELNKYERLAKKEKIVTAKIKDAGKTEVKPGTITCLAIGPDESKKIDKISGKLKLV